jgi:L-fucose mutarotase
LKVLAEMGHGDRIVLGDANFPSRSCASNICVRADGHASAELLDAILTLFPLEKAECAPVEVMEVAEDGAPEPEIWSAYRKILAAHGYDAELKAVERFEYYGRTQSAYAVIATGETALYANISLNKGVI